MAGETEELPILPRLAARPVRVYSLREDEAEARPWDHLLLTIFAASSNST